MGVKKLDLEETARKAHDKDWGAEERSVGEIRQGRQAGAQP